MSTAKVDLSRFNKAVALMMAMPKRVGPDVLNKSVLQVTVGSGGGNKGLVQLTKKATAARIKADMAVMITTVGPRGGAHSAPRVVLLATNWLIKKGIRPMGWGKDAQLLWRSQVSDACDRIIKARIQSRAFIAAGWLWAASALAQFVPGNTLSRLMGGKNLPLKSNGEAALSFARNATPSTLFAGVYNTSTGANIIVTVGTLQLAVNGEVNNLRAYFEKKAGEAIKRAVELIG